MGPSVKMTAFRATTGGEDVTGNIHEARRKGRKRAQHPPRAEGTQNREEGDATSALWGGVGGE